MEIFALIAVIIAVLLFIFRKKFFSRAGGNVEYLKVGDPNAQDIYEKGKGADIPKLTAKELLELSWKFLYDVTEAVLYRFSATSRKVLQECGEVLVRAGMRYTHVVDYTPVRKASKARSIDDEQNDATSIQR